MIPTKFTASAGTAIGTITVAQDSAVGDIDELTIASGTTYTAAGRLDRGNTSRDAINLETTSAGNTSYQGVVYMYFVRDNE